MKPEHRSFFLYDFEPYSENLFFNGHNITKHNYSFLPFFYISKKKTYKINIATNARFMEYKLSIYSMLRSRRSRKYSVTPILTNFTNYSAEIFYEYLKLRKSTFTGFFNDYSVDTPICFYGSNSIKRRNFEFPMLKFTNFLMRDGKREKVFIAFLNAFHVISNTLRINASFVNTDWSLLYRFIDTTLLQSNNFMTINCRMNINILYNHFFYDKKKSFSETFYFYTLLWKIIKIITPLFAFSVYSVDKNIRKFSRSQTNKYVFVWKYIPAYKRNLRILRLIAKDIKFNNSKTFNERIVNSFLTLHANPKDSFVWQINQFSHNYVFKNLKKSLLRTLKSTS